MKFLWKRNSWTWREYPDLYELVKNISEVVYDGYALDYKTQKLIAIGITASRADPRATKNK